MRTEKRTLTSGRVIKAFELRGGQYNGMWAWNFDDVTHEQQTAAFNGTGPIEHQFKCPFKDVDACVADAEERP